MESVTMHQRDPIDGSTVELAHSTTTIRTPGEPQWTAPLVQRFAVQKDPEAVNSVQAYLKAFGHVDKAGELQDMATALQDLQRLAHIPTTGVYDEATREVMSLPRCGTRAPTAPTTGAAATPIAGKFVAASTKWDHTHITYRFENFSPDIDQLSQRLNLQSAFKKWADITPLTFAEVATGQPADIVIKFVANDHGDGTPFNGPSGTLAHGFYPPPNGGDIAGDIHFDEDEVWTGPSLYQVALHEIGHSLGLMHSDVEAAVMWEWFAPKEKLHPDDIAGIHSQYGWWQPKWTRLDDNPLTIQILASSSGRGIYRASDGLYQLQSNGRILRYQGAMGWTLLDNNPRTVQITSSSGSLYQRHNNGSIWRYTGTPISGWQLIDNNPATVEIMCRSSALYQRHNNGMIWLYTGTPFTGWQLLDQNPRTVEITASMSGILYQRHNNGTIWRYTGTPISGWQLLDNNQATIAIAAGGTDELYQLHGDGAIWRYTGTPMTGWEVIDSNPQTKGIYAAGTYLYQIHKTGAIWRYTGTPGTGWEWLDGSANTTHIIGEDNGVVWQLKRPGGEIFKLTDGAPAMV